MGLDGSNYRRVRRAEAETIGKCMGVGKETCQGELSLSSPFSSPCGSTLCGAVIMYFFWGGVKGEI